MTYSLGITGARATPSLPAIYTLSDANAQLGSQQQAMMCNQDILCQGPDGVQRYYRIDAERSIPGYPPVLIPSGRS